MRGDRDAPRRTRPAAHRQVAAWLAALALSMLAAACATTGPSYPPPATAMLTEAGFKTLAASTPLQQQQLGALRTDALTAVQRTGKHYYVYPDVPASKLYVGTPKEYEAYVALRTKAGLANPDLTASTAADMQIYMKQDNAMMAATAREAGIPDWAYWPDFGGMGWLYP
jgi:hypothetical protein